jgi:outer membrane protein OmpA-like peptidoglycan-associated protein
MKKIVMFCIVLALAVSIFSQEKQLDQRSTYVYKGKQVLISASDLNCSYFIAKKFPMDIKIVGSALMGDKRLYTDGDNLYINKGSKDGLKEGDSLLIISKGHSIFNPLTHGRLGYLFTKKSLATITAVWEDKGLINLIKGCYDVNIGDYAIPHKPEQTVIGAPVSYKDAKLPKTGLVGNVVYANILNTVEKNNPASHDYVTTDFGKAELSRGNFVLFYKIIKKKLPPLIIGTGIAINIQNNNSTIKVLDSSQPVTVGTKLVLLPEEKQMQAAITGEREKIPVVDAVKKEPTKPQPGQETKEVNVLFNLNSKTIGDTYKSELDGIKEFISGKSNFVVILKGYACSIGGIEYNLKLSQERVEAIKGYLIKEFGINESQIETYFYGEKDAPFDNTSEAERRKNRLVTIQVISK